MTSLQMSGASQTRTVEQTSVPLIDSINRIPFNRVREDESYVISGKAMNEIVSELRKLWQTRTAIADLLAEKNAPAS